MTDEATFIFSDLALSRRLERAEAQSNARFVEARAKAFPESGAMWVEVAGAYAMFDGAESPITQTFGLGLFADPAAADLERIEGFYRERGAPVFHEVSPLADARLVPLLNERGYHPCEFITVMFRPLTRKAADAGPGAGKIKVRLLGRDEQALWAQTSARGWSEFPELADFMNGLRLVSERRTDALNFLAELEGSPVATGTLIINDGVGLLAGASTVPEGRRQGAQLALLDARLAYAAEQGCDLAMMCARPGTPSQRNAERQGFRIAYTRTKWELSGLAP